MKEDKKKEALEFIRKHTLAVVSTTNSNGRPESALVAFAETDKLEIIFGTLNTTRKYRNIKNNPHVSIVIGWEEDVGVTIQYEGVAKEVSGSELELCRNIQIKKNPGSEEYAYNKAQGYFKITPKWIRYTDISTKPETVFEIDF